MRVFKLSAPDFWKLYNYFLLELSCAVASSRASTPWMPVALSLHYKTKYVFKNCQMSPYFGEGNIAPANNYCFRS